MGVNAELIHDPFQKCQNEQLQKDYCRPVKGSEYHQRSNLLLVLGMRFERPSKDFTWFQWFEHI